MAELDSLDPIPEQVTLTSGLQIQLERLRSRQFFKLLRIITQGAMPQMQSAGLFDTDGLDASEFTSRLITVTLLSIPEAEDQTIDFVRSMGKPVGLIERRDLNKQDAERNLTLWTRFDEELDNPELDDLVTIIEAVVRREAADIQALGKRLAAMFNLAVKTGQIQKTPNQSLNQTESTSASSVDSHGPSISSPRSTGGRTKSSSTSASRVSASVSRASKSAASTSATSGISG